MTLQQRLRIIIPVVLAGVAALWWFTRGTDPGSLFVSGSVEAVDADLGFQLPGRIDTVAVREGDRVAAGDLVAALDRSTLIAQRRAAEANVSAARARLDELVSGFRPEEVAQGRSALSAADQRLAQATREVERARRLHEGGAVSRDALDRAETAFEVARAERDRAADALVLLREGPRPEQLAVGRAALQQALAALDQAEATLRHAEILAPFAGTITNRHREPGEVVPAGAPVVTLMDPGSRYVRIFVREDAVGRVAIGQTARISADAYPDRTYEGEVTYIASEAEFTPRTVQTTEERVKLVYEVRVRIVTDDTYDLKPGLSADVDLRPSA